MPQDTIMQIKKVSSAEMNKIRQKKQLLSLLRTHGSTSAPELSKWLKTSLENDP